jgi:multidrug efflux pump subunit AcrB
MEDGGPAGGILSYFARHRTAANLLMLVMLVLGIAAIPNMRAQFFPDIISDEVSVSVRWDGAGAEDVDAAIVAVLEPALLAVEGVVATEARSREGSANIELEFEPGWDMGRASDDVQAAVDAVTSLPEDADDPQVSAGGWRDRVTDVVITGPVDVGQLARFADEFVVRLFAEGVTRTTIQGIAAPETVIEVPSLQLIRHDVTMREIADAIAAAAATNPAGEVTGSARVRTGVERRSADQIAEIVLRTNPDGSSLTIGDVGVVRVEGVDRERAYFVGDNPAIAVRVDRSAQGDAIRIQATVEEVAAEMERGLPAGVTVDLIRTRAEAITGRLNILLTNGAMGLALVVGLLFLFLNARTALWVAAGIPVSMIAAIAIMYAAGLTFNMISLFALILTLGIVVDDAIVVAEHADFRARRLGEPPQVAAERAARRMFMPVFASTATTVIAFFGLVAIGGRFGDLIADIPFTVIVVLLASLVECFLILPNHMAHALAHTAKQHWYDWPSRQFNKGFRWFRDRIFRRLIAGVVRLRYPVLAGAVALLAWQAAAFIRGDVQWRFFASPETSSISGNFAMLPGATREDTLAFMRALQATVEELGAKYEEEHGTNPLLYVLAEVGGTAGPFGGAETKDADLLGGVSIELIEPDLRPYSTSAFVAELQDAVPAHPLLETVSFRGGRGGPGGDALSVRIYGADAVTLKAAAEALKAEVSQYPEVSGVEDTLAYDKEEVVLDLTPQGQALGVTIDDLGRVLRDQLNGIEAATYPDGPRSAAIRVELPEGELTADFLERVQVRAAPGVYVPLADIVTVESRTGFSTVRRENGVRLVSVTGDISEDDPARAAEIMAALDGAILPALEERFGVETELSGLAEQEREFLSDATTGLILCLAGIYLTLAWVFSSWTRPLIVMAIIPFGLIGTLFGHERWDVALSMFSVVGIIGMIGIIVNDSIVLVSTVDEYAKERGLIPAIIDGTADRLRPVVLTTLTTILGLAPLLFESSDDAQFLKPTVITLVYGLGFGLFIVLLMVPALLGTQHDAARLLASLRRAGGQMSRSGPVGAATAVAAVGAAAVFALTLGPALLTGGLPGPLAALAPGGSPGAAFLLFVAGTAAVVLAVWAVAAVLIGRRAGRA